jgi:uncharacterized protein YdhG (YjbR/CyaY superfamily)
MQKEKSRRKRPAVKPHRAKKSTPKTLAQYAARVPRAARTRFRELRAAIHAAMPPGAGEAISYGIPAIKKDKIIVWFAAFSDHCSLFPTAAVIADFAEELRGYSLSKGTIHFPLNQPLPAALIKKIVKARAAQMH